MGPTLVIVISLIPEGALCRTLCADLFFASPVLGKSSKAASWATHWRKFQLLHQNLPGREQKNKHRPGLGIGIIIAFGRKF